MPSATRRQVMTGATAAAIAPGLIAAHAAPASDGRHAAASAIAERLFAAKEAPALSLAVARPSGVIWAQALGQADVQLGVAATPAHSFCLGSVSKVLTSTAAARLASRGLLNLDAGIGTYLPALPEQHRKTSLRQLLTHRGGVRHYRGEELSIANKAGAIYMRAYAGDADVLALFIDDPLVAAPGTSVKYSSYGYTLASLAMQAAAGRDFREVIRHEIAEPFGLASLAADEPWALRPSRAGRYMNARDMGVFFSGIPKESWPRLTGGLANMPLCNPAYCWAGGGFLMTPTDTARFGAALLPSADARISPAERALLFTPMTAAQPDSPPLGLGWRIDRDGKGRLRWHHAGATGGARFFLAIYPEQGLSIAMAANVMTIKLNVAQAASDLVDIFG
jgi:CubicO group peptidase (beta-lactamase class C family)